MKKIIVFIILLFIAISIPVTVYLLSHQQETRSRADTVVSDSTVIATINSEDVTRGDLRKVAEEQYDPSAVDNTALKDALDVVIERKVLDIEVTQGNISASTDEVSKLMNDKGFDQTKAYYNILIDKATLKYTKARQALSIGFWVSPAVDVATFNQVDKVASAKKLSDGLLALDEAKTRMIAGDDILAIAQSLSTKYPSIAPIIAVNGYILSDSQKSLDSIAQPQIYGFDKANSGPVFFTTLFASTLNVGDIEKVLGEDQSGGSIIKLLEKNDNAQYATYNDWLESKKSYLVMIKTSL